MIISISRCAADSHTSCCVWRHERARASARTGHLWCERVRCASERCVVCVNSISRRDFPHRRRPCSCGQLGGELRRAVGAGEVDKQQETWSGLSWWRRCNPCPAARGIPRACGRKAVDVRYRAGVLRRWYVRVGLDLGAGSHVAPALPDRPRIFLLHALHLLWRQPLLICPTQSRCGRFDLSVPPPRHVLDDASSDFPGTLQDRAEPDTRSSPLYFS